jgi:uncharacterized protein (TIGR02271 family)
MCPADDPERLVLAEERLSIDKHRVVTGRVRIRSQTDAVETLAHADLDGEAIEVTHVPVDRRVNEPPAVRTEGDVTIFPVLEEVLVLEKQLFLKEEIHVRRRRTREEVEIPVTLRRQRAVVERLDPDSAESETEDMSSREVKTNE